MLFSIRRWLWRHYRIPLPPEQGWSSRVRDVASCDGVWIGDGLVGAPIEWSLLTRDGTGKIVPRIEQCAICQQPASGASDVMEQWGVRCARCGVPLHCREAGMRNSLSIPSCLPCRWIVRIAEWWAKMG